MVVRFTDSRYERVRTEKKVRSLFAGVSDIEVRSIPLRSIFVALAKSAQPRKPGE